MAKYEGDGRGYVRHFDVNKDANHSSDRKLTCIFYANLHWKEADGGHLKLFIPQSNPEEYELISPIANRIVIFQSRHFPHEVCSSFSHRYALAIWMH